MALTKEQLVALTPTERMDTKATEIAKFDLAGRYTDKTYGVEIEVVSVSKIDKGVEVLARAWKDGKQLGFGPKGAIDIERFRIINPPVSVPDGTFTKKTFFDPAVKADVEYDEPNYKIDPEAAIKEAIASIASQVGRGGKSIVKDLVGSTTTTVYADPSTFLLQQTAEQTWATKHDDTAATNALSDDQRWLYYCGCGDAPDRYNTMTRTGYVFDTSAIPDSDTISAATFSVFGDTTCNQNTFTNGVLASTNIYSFSPADTTAPVVIAVGDYDQFGTTAYCDTSISYSSWSTSAYNDFVLNSTGISAISKTGLTFIGARDATYDVPNSPYTWEAGKIQRNGARFAAASGTANDPKLVITHSAEAPNTTSFFPFLDRR